jgi:hypothetical protein
MKRWLHSMLFGGFHPVLIVVRSPYFSVQENTLLKEKLEAFDALQSKCETLQRTLDGQMTPGDPDPQQQLRLEYERLKVREKEAEKRQSQLFAECGALQQSKSTLIRGLDTQKDRTFKLQEDMRETMDKTVTLSTKEAILRSKNTKLEEMVEMTERTNHGLRENVAVLEEEKNRLEAEKRALDAEKRRLEGSSSLPYSVLDRSEKILEMNYEEMGCRVNLIHRFLFFSNV